MPSNKYTLDFVLFPISNNGCNVIIGVISIESINILEDVWIMLSNSGDPNNPSINAFFPSPPRLANVESIFASSSIYLNNITPQNSAFLSSSISKAAAFFANDLS